jgi:mannose-1-phosphate guanylyltransferase
MYASLSVWLGDEDHGQDGSKVESRSRRCPLPHRDPEWEHCLSSLAVTLAGGEGKRLRPLIERIHPDGRAKQFAVLLGSRSLLRQTLDRVALAVPRERTVVVATKSHAPFFATEFAAPDAPRVLVQPRDLGTAAGVLLPVHWISWLDPDAVVAVFPSDHFVGNDRIFMRHVAGLARLAERHPHRIFLVGARPDSAETGYGWIEPGATLASTGVRLVDRFCEKPSADAARACMARGGLWSTFVMVAKASAIIEAGRSALPSLDEALSRIRPFAGSAGEAAAIERACATAPTASFSHAVLAALPSALAVSTLPPIAWSDWGTPERVVGTLRRQGIAPPWLGRLAPTA